MKVVILAGGEGKRLRPYTYILPKPLLPIGEKSILDIVIEKLKVQGIKDVFLAVNYKADIFQTIFGNGSSRGVNISYIKESTPLGTAGPLKSFDGNANEDFLVMNGDIIAEFDIKELEDFHRKSGSDLTIVTKKIETPIEFGVLKTEADRVIDWIEKPKIESEISCGIYIVNSSVLKYIPENKFFGMPDLAREIMNCSGKVCKFEYKGKMFHISQIKDYENAENDLGLKK
jgi:NDP-sugar pyrophosphorylase family protein